MSGRRAMGVPAIFVIILACALAGCGSSSTSRHPNSTAVPTATRYLKGWSEVSSPGVGHEGTLIAVTALSTTNAWAVGQYAGLDSLQRTLVEHWDGAQWDVQESPSPGREYNLLQGVSAASPSDAWAVGYYASTEGVDQPLVEHWNGASWTVMSGPAVGQAGGRLYGVAAISATNAWAVGYVNLPSSANAAPGAQPLVEHWDGHTWSIAQSAAIPAPQTTYSTAPNNELYAITALSANDMWVAGGDNAGSGTPGTQALLEHWDGRTWRLVPVESPDLNDNTLTGLAAVSPTDIWAVGSGALSGPFGCGIASGVLIEHWDGSRWSSVPAAQPAGNSPLFSLAGIAAVSAHDVWAVGGHLAYTSGQSAVVEPLIEHWDGSQWNLVASPVAASAQGLAGIAAAPGGAVWAVGQLAAPNGPAETLVEQESAGQWSVVASPSPGTLRNALNSVTALSANDVWAVGESAGGTLAEHWNGNGWGVFTTPNSTSHDDVLNGVSGAAANDVWAVGSANGANDGAQALIEHWNGGSWSAVPTATAAGATLNGVAAVSASDVWAVGSDGAGPLIEHWDGLQWNAVPTPTSVPGLYINEYTLYSVAAAAPNNVWAAGGIPIAGCSGVAPALIEHWDGKQWSVVTGLPQGVLYGVAVAGASDAWAVGQLDDGAGILHWDGTRWAAIAAAALPAHTAPTFRAVAAHSRDDVWVVGYTYGSQGGAMSQALHWDGHVWAAAQLGSPGIADNAVNGIAAVSTGEFWCVGSYDDWSIGDARQALIEHYQP